MMRGFKTLDLTLVRAFLTWNAIAVNRDVSGYYAEGFNILVSRFTQRGLQKLLTFI
jgi:hypothetical protein